MSQYDKENIPSHVYVGASWKKKNSSGYSKGSKKVRCLAERESRIKKQCHQATKGGDYTELRPRSGLQPLDTNRPSKHRYHDEKQTSDKKSDRSYTLLKEAEEKMENLRISTEERSDFSQERRDEHFRSFPTYPCHIDENDNSLLEDNMAYFENEHPSLYTYELPFDFTYNTQELESIAKPLQNQGFCNYYSTMLGQLQPPSLEPSEQDGVPAFVDPDGFITLRLNHQIIVDISANQAVRVRDAINQSCLSVSSCGLQMAMVHKKGRVLQYGSRIEIQCRDEISIKNAKMYPKGISFTANNLTLVYLVDIAGARTTSDMFHDLYENNIADTLFREACKHNPENAVEICKSDLMRAQYWRNQNNEDCWVFGQIFVLQKPDGLTRVDRRTEEEFILMKASPTTGKVRLGNKFASVTASLGDQSHVFVKAQERRLHYNGQNLNFTVRNAGHAAGFDETGQLRLF